MTLLFARTPSLFHCTPTILQVNVLWLIAPIFTLVWVAQQLQQQHKQHTQ
jgi:hypothetical protein